MSLKPWRGPATTAVAGGTDVPLRTKSGRLRRKSTVERERQRKNHLRNLREQILTQEKEEAKAQEAEEARLFPEMTEFDINKVIEEQEAEQDAKCENCKEMRWKIKHLENRETRLTNALEVLSVRLTMAMTRSGKTW